MNRRGARDGELHERRKGMNNMEKRETGRKRRLRVRGEKRKRVRRAMQRDRTYS